MAFAHVLANIGGVFLSVKEEGMKQISEVEEKTVHAVFNYLSRSSYYGPVIYLVNLN